MKPFTPITLPASKNSLIFFVLILIFGITSSLSAQQITITPGTSLVLNGNVSLIINNAALRNNGTFSAGNSTVNFTGNNDTTASYISGSSTTTLNNLTVSKSAYGVALKSAVIVKNVLAVNAGNLYTDSNLTLKSDSKLTARVAAVSSGSNIIGKTNVERYVNAIRAWRLITAPVSNSNSIFNSWQNNGIYTTGMGTIITGTNPTGAEGNGLDYSTQNSASMKGFDRGTQQFTKVLNTKVAISGNTGNADNIGYFVFVRGDRNPANTVNGNVNTTTLTSTGSLQTGDQKFTASPDAAKYTLIGNPYASPVNFDNVTRNNLIKRFYIWDPKLNTVGGYVMMDDLDNNNNYDKSVVGSTQTNDLQSGQAFFVQTLSNGPASITFTESSKSANNSNLMFRPAPISTAGVGNGQIRTSLNLLNANNTTILADGVIARFNDVFSADVDLDDAAKFSNTNENICIVRNNALLAAERRPVPGSNDTLFFRIWTTTQRDYQFVFDADGLQIPGRTAFLEDNFLATSTPVSLQGITTVNFAINADAASAAVNRFRIVFKQVVSPVTISSVKAYQKKNYIAVEWTMENESGMVKYDVEKSTDGKIFTQVNTTNATGTGDINNTYSWLDVKSVQGNNFYRIKSYDKSGVIKFSSIVKVAIGKTTGARMTTAKSTEASGFSIYPNPVTGNVINLVMRNQTAGQYQVTLTNTTGQSIFVKTIQSNGGNSTEALNAGSKLPAGIYQLEIIGQDNNHNTQKVIVE